MTLPSTFKVAEAIDEAFERIQINPASISAEHLVSARRSIRLLLSSWNNDSVMFWKVLPQQTHTYTLGQASFVLPAGTLDILSGQVKRDVYRTPMLMLARDDWFAIPDRDTTQGMPTRYWVERDTAPPTVHNYPKSENATDIFVYDAWVQFNDSSQLSGAADVPERWTSAFVSGLTAALAEKFAPALYAAKARSYGGPMFVSPPGTQKTAYEIARAGDRERGDTIFVMSRHRRTRR